MPALVETQTDGIRPFTHHGVELTGSGRQREGDCPFCGKPKLTVEADAGLWRCFVCGRTGNPLEFIRQLWEASDKATNGWSKKMAQERGLLDEYTVTAWGVCKSVVDGVWLVPAYNTSGKLHQLYRRVQTQKSDGSWVWTLMPTPALWPDGKSHGLHMASLDFDPQRGEIFVAEGPWDGMAFWETARQAKRVSDILELTGNPQSSLLSDANVVAVPGCTSWQDAWTELCRGKVVTLLYDNDHPRDNNGTVTMAGYDGMKRVAGKLAGVAKVVQYLQWGGGGFDAALPDGYDVRDALTKGL